jgi:2-(1,2-epoxy-1,2-dihydrophenyl)acetyl-CoA isomerase
MSNELQDLLVERRDGVLYLTMNRPEKLNPISNSMIGGIIEQLRQAAKDLDVGAVVLTGAGRGFCSGADVSRMGGRRDESRRQDSGETLREPHKTVAVLRHWQELTLLLHEMPKITIAAVNGPATGAGLVFALACDIRIAADTARFGTAFARVGFCGDFGGTYFLTRLVGPAKARELYLTAEVLGAEEALKLGIVNRVVPAASLTAEVDTFAKRIAAGPLVAYSYMKANANLALTGDLRTVQDAEALGTAMCLLTEDQKEAARAFMEKRAPRFKGR